MRLFILLLVSLSASLSDNPSWPDLYTLDISMYFGGDKWRGGFGDAPPQGDDTYTGPIPLHVETDTNKDVQLMSYDNGVYQKLFQGKLVYTLYLNSSNLLKCVEKPNPFFDLGQLFFEFLPNMDNFSCDEAVPCPERFETQDCHLCSLKEFSIQNYIVWHNLTVYGSGESAIPVSYLVSGYERYLEQIYADDVLFVFEKYTPNEVNPSIYRRPAECNTLPNDGVAASASPPSVAGLDGLDPAPITFNWSTYGFTNQKMYSQGSFCHSSWAYAVADSIRTQLKFRTGKDYNISAQSFIDCCWEYGTYGCEIDTGIGQVENCLVGLGGLMTDEEYGNSTIIPGACKFKEEKSINFRVSEFKKLNPENDQESIKFLYMYGPLIAAMNLSEYTIYYKGGLVSDDLCDFQAEKFYALIIGYANWEGDADRPSWIVKTSFGKYWGDSGYIHLEREAANCGLDGSFYVPVLTAI